MIDELQSTNPISRQHRGAPNLQSAIWISLRLLSIFGGLMLLCYSSKIAVIWMFSVGMISVIVGKLPARWFDKADAKRD